MKNPLHQSHPVLIVARIFVLLNIILILDRLLLLRISHNWVVGIWYRPNSTHHHVCRYIECCQPSVERQSQSP